MSSSAPLWKGVDDGLTYWQQDVPAADEIQWQVSKQGWRYDTRTDHFGWVLGETQNCCSMASDGFYLQTGSVGHHLSPTSFFLIWAVLTRAVLLSPVLAGAVRPIK